MEEKLNRGDLFYAVLEDDNYIGSEQTGIRPVLILQNDIGNKFKKVWVLLKLI